jgi:Flp pilus assembly pilin Flp
MSSRGRFVEVEGIAMRVRIARLALNDEGQDLVEYGLLVGIITLATVLAITTIGTKVKTYFDNLNAAVP